MLRPAASRSSVDTGKHIANPKPGVLPSEGREGQRPHVAAFLETKPQSPNLERLCRKPLVCPQDAHVSIDLENLSLVLIAVD